jgi:hypothetical protein
MCIALATSTMDTPTSPSTTVETTVTNPKDNTSPPLHQVSDDELEPKPYNFDLPSRPISVYHIGTPLKGPTGLEAHCEARPVISHPIVDTWDDLGPQVCDILDSINIMWTSIDVVCFVEVQKCPGPPGPPVIWIGVKPESLPRKDAEVATVGCKGLFKTFGLTDIEIAFRESVFTRSAGPNVSSEHSTANIRSPLTPTLGVQIAA